MQEALLQRFPAFRSPNFRRLFLNSFFQAAATWALLLGRGWLMFSLTHSSMAVGLVTLVAMLPFVVVGPFAGAIADRVDRRRMALGGAIASIVLATVLAVLAIGGLITPWQIVAIALIAGIARSISTPAEESLVPNVVPPEHLVSAIALGGISRFGSRVVGPLFGGVLLATLGPGYVFMLSAALFAGSIYQLARVRWVHAGEHLAIGGLRDKARGVLVDVREGLHYVESDMRAAMVLVLVGLHCGLTMAFDSMMPTLAVHLGGAERTFSAILVGIGVGSIAGTLVLSMMRDQRMQGRLMAMAGVGSGLSMVVLGLATLPAVAVIGAMLAGATQATYMALSAAFVQSVVPDALRGRVLALYAMLGAGNMAFLNFGFGWLADGVGTRVLLIVPGLIWTAIFVTASFTVPELRALLGTGTFRPRARLTAVEA